MAAQIKSSNESSEAARYMGHNVESKKGSRQHQLASAVKEKILSPGGRKSYKFQDNSVAVNPSGKPFADHQHNGLRKHMDDRHVVHQQPSVAGQNQQLQSKANKDDELVKYMSNLPGFLQQAEKKKNVQVKALNFGVLDWKLLEKWKHNEHMLGRGQPKAASSGNSLSVETGKSTLSETLVGRKKSSTDFHLKPPTEGRSSQDVQQSQGKVKHIQDPRSVSQSSNADHQKDFSRSLKSSCKDYPATIHDKGKTKEADQIERTFSMSSLSFGKQQGKSSTTVDNDIKGSSKYCNAEPQNIVLLMPKCPSKRSSSHDSWSLASSYGQLAREAGNKLSGCSSSHELRSSEISCDIPHSCPLPPSVAVPRDKVSDAKGFPCQSDILIKPRSPEAIYTEGKTSDLGTPQKTESSASSHRFFVDGIRKRNSESFSSQDFHSTELHSDFWTFPFQQDSSIEHRLSNATCPESKSCNFDDSVSVDGLREMDSGFGKQTAGQGRHPSPSRRFSFSLSRLSRSFSFKESSTAAEPGPGKFNVSAAIGDGKRDKANASGRRRPSPFRRLLDPLLKIKASHFTEAVQTKGAQTFERNSSSLTYKPTNKPFSNDMNSRSTIQAFLQLTVKNGLPFFKFVVDDRSDILAAALNQLPTSGKADRTLTYSFYSVHEIKKKAGGWITNGSKVKNCGFGYSVVAKMTITSSFLLKLNAAENCNEQSLVTESVLYDINIAQGDKGTTDVSPNREIAAIILQDPIDKCNVGESKEGNSCEQQDVLDPSSCNASCNQEGDKEDCSSATVILPGALHSLPYDGTPSSLIQRWRSGGLCDCGGWDVGCKLKILTNCNRPGSNYSNPDHMNLFIQSGDGKGQPTFSLAPFKDGLYSVELNSSVSLLEGFSICVAIITNREFSDIFDMKQLPEAILSAGGEAGNDEKKNEIKLQNEVPAKFVSSPPSSPASRI